MKAFVIGNAALDETVSVDDFPRPGASIFGQALSQDLGGKGVNQAVAMARTGLACHLIAAVGQDARGREIAARLAAEPVMAQLIALPGVATDNSIILMAGHGENAVITTRAAAGAMTPDHAIVADDEIDLGPRLQPGMIPHHLGNGDLALGGDAHDDPIGNTASITTKDKMKQSFRAATQTGRSGDLALVRIEKGDDKLRNKQNMTA